MSQTQVCHVELPEPSALRTRILDEAKAAARQERKTRARTWTKRPKYEGQQFTLDLKGGMNELRPSKKRKPDSQSLSPKDFTPPNPSPGSHGQDNIGENVRTKYQATSEPSIDEDDEWIQGSHTQEPEPAHAWLGGATRLYSPAAQSKPELAESMPTDPAICNGRAKMQPASDPIMDELDKMTHKSRAQEPDPATTSPWVRGSNGIYDPEAQPRPEPKYTMPMDPRWPEMLIHPDSKPISQEQLAAEVKSIYAGLTMVESKCIQVDKAQAMLMRDGSGTLSNDHWQALIALHKTLLHEHHDFFLASQHPSASPALKDLAVKYAMPNRMWRNDIHSLLEILSQKPKEHSDGMAKFLRMVHETMDMLQENVPSMQDEWDKILDALGTFERKMLDEEEMWHLREQTYPLANPDIELGFEFGDIYNSTLTGTPHTLLEDDQLGGPWFPEHVTDILSAWLYLGSGICAHNFNLFVKTFTVMAIAAWPTQLMWPVI